MIPKKFQPKKRLEKIRLLESYLLNPGRFSILVLGNRGTGKKVWIRQKHKSNFYTINSALTKPSEQFWEEKFKQADQGILIIEDVELLTKETQEVLFDGLATTDGNFGYASKIYEVRIVFTSSKGVSVLRETEKYLSHKFFDRIAQLVVRFPNFNECANKIENDFKNTWKKFEFTTAFPDELIPWLNENAHTLHGNFRDLDKLCIIWNNYQLMGLSEEKILKKVKEDFDGFNKFPEMREESFFEINFSTETSYHDMLDNFRRQVKIWAKKEFPSLRKAGEALGVSHRTIERW